MQIGFIGHDEMGLNLALVLKNKGYDVVAFDVQEQSMNQFRQAGIKSVTSIKDLTESVDSKRIIWLMLPAGQLIDGILNTLTPYLSVGDIVIDGGDSNYQDSIRRAKTVEAFQINFLDCGIGGRTEGVLHNAMIGGNRFAFNYCESLFKAIAAPGGYLYCGVSGSGHFVNMIYNGVKKDLIQAISGGLEALRKSEFKLDLEKVASAWKQSTVQGEFVDDAQRKQSKP